MFADWVFLLVMNPSLTGKLADLGALTFIEILNSSSGFKLTYGFNLIV